jgi:hypothetical protein
MNERKSALIITFSTATEAMEADKFFTERQLPGRLIPVPREITADCGLAWRAPPEERDRLTQSLREAHLRWAAFYMIEI